MLSFQKIHLYLIQTCDVTDTFKESGVDSSVNLHDRAGVAALLAALADQERSGSFTLEHLLGLRSTQLPDEPIRLILMGQILFVSLQHVRAETTRRRLEAALWTPSGFRGERTYSSRLSLCIPSQSLMRFCRTPL